MSPNRAHWRRRGGKGRGDEFASDCRTVRPINIIDPERVHIAAQYDRIMYRRARHFVQHPVAVGGIAIPLITERRLMRTVEPKRSEKHLLRDNRPGTHLACQAVG